VAGAAFLGAFSSCELSHPTAVLSINGTNDGIHPYSDSNGWYFTVPEINNYWASYNNTDLNPIITELPDINNTDGSTVERYSWINGDGCVHVEELKIINGGHDWPSPLSSWGNQDINANTEVWNFVSKFNMDGLINCNYSNNLEIVNSTNNNLIRIIDVYGRESNKISNQLLFYIYENGESIKKFILE
jgi:polyhydroxybutyrate depolymerase